MKKLLAVLFILGLMIGASAVEARHWRHGGWGWGGGPYYGYWGGPYWGPGYWGGPGFSIGFSI